MQAAGTLARLLTGGVPRLPVAPTSLSTVAKLSAGGVPRLLVALTTQEHQLRRMSSELLPREHKQRRHCQVRHGGTNQEMKFDEYDIVQLLVPVGKLAAGAIGTALMRFADTPPHYEVESLGQEGETLTISENDLKEAVRYDKKTDSYQFDS